MNNEDSKYDILINHDLINNFYKYSTFEHIPFLNIDVINKRILNKNIYFSLLFSLYSLSETFRPYGDYNFAQKFKIIAFQFLELAKYKKKINDIQIIETYFILASSGNICFLINSNIFYIKF